MWLVQLNVFVFFRQCWNPNQYARWLILHNAHDNSLQCSHDMGLTTGTATRIYKEQDNA